jgi:hypothetical protein
MMASVRKRALKVALLVGSILAVINHGDIVLAGTATATVWTKIVLTFLVPYGVATFASVQAIRQGMQRESEISRKDAEMQRNPK